tara:strand:+ start:417 stop:611 length:195 start_codon:yes stop_codon:yes gene_type:complete
MESNKIIEYISTINKSKKMRKLSITDIFDNPLFTKKYDYRHRKGPRVKRYRQQQEYGEKMRIKP